MNPSAKIKVAHIVTSYTSVTTILDIKLRTLNQFEDLEVWAISSPPDKFDHSQIAIPFIALPMTREIKPFGDLKSIWKLYRILKLKKFSVVHSHTAKAGMISAIAAWLARVPIRCHTYHGLPFYNNQKKRQFLVYRFLEKAACLLRHYLFSQNQHDFRQCVDLIGTQSKVTIEGNGVDPDFIFAKAKEQHASALQMFPEQGIKLLLVSRLEPVKRVDDFFKVVKALRDQGLMVCAVVAGDGHLKNELEKTLKKLHLENCVKMVGFTRLVYGLIAACDIVVLCSEKEGIPRALMEAMALSKPVVATDVVGTQEVVVHNHTGYLVSLGNLKEMVSKVMKLCIDPELRLSMGCAGHSRALKHFNDHQIAAMLHDFYIDKYLYRM